MPKLITPPPPEPPVPPKRRPGRPRIDDPLIAQFKIRLRPDTFDFAQNHGGVSWVRGLLEAAAAGRITLPADPNAEQKHVPTGSNVDVKAARPLAGAPAAANVDRIDLRAMCGWPAPASEPESESVDLSELLVPNPESSILVETSGDSMVDAGIFEGDLVVVDLGREARSGSIVLVLYDGSFMIKRLRIRDGRPELHSENAEARYTVLRPRPGEQFEVKGVVTSVTHLFN